MTRLRFQDGVLLLEGSGDKRIFEWEHRLFFSIAAGYKLDDASGCYLFSKQAEMQEVLKARLTRKEKESQLAAISQVFADHLQQSMRLTTLDSASRKEVREQISALSIDQDTNAYTRMLLAELAFCDRHGQKRSNEIGIFDMSGNVWEWCSDWYKANYYSISPKNNPKGPSSGNGKVCRGGCWSSGSPALLCTSRTAIYPQNRNRHIGFRLARSEK